MAKVSTTAGWGIGSNAALQAWLTEYRDMLVAAGLVQTSDTGQTDPTTATWPGTGGLEAANFLFRFDDALQSTAPIVFKIRILRGTTGNGLSCGIEVGTGSNGAGNITGTKREMAPNLSSIGSPGAGSYNSYAIHKEGYAAMIFKTGGTTGATSNGIPSFVIQRTVDNTGAPTAEGVHVIICTTSMNATNGQSRAFRLRFLPTSDAGAEYTGAGLGYFPGAVMDSRVGLSPQIFTHWIMLPKQKPLLFTGGCLRGEVAVGNQFDLILVGVTPRRYLCVGPAMGGVLTVPNLTAVSDLVILWED